MKVALIRYTPDPDGLCGEAAALCTGYKGPRVNALRGAMKSGHESIAEHATFTFIIEDISRVTLAQLTRHRFMSFSVQSQRYCGADTENVVIPDSCDLNGMYGGSIGILLDDMAALYNSMVEFGIPAEDARYYLPQCITTKLMLTANARELRHFFSLRCCNRAQWEIQELACNMLNKCKFVAPELFKDAGPGCVRGRCPERKPCKEGYHEQSTAASES